MQAYARYTNSWTAYLLPAAGLVLAGLLSRELASHNLNLALLLALAGLVLFSYKVLMLRSLILYTDEQGVWICRGIFPWARGVTGVKWRDLQDAVYFQGFFSWLLASYTVRVGHRFTKTSELLLPHIGHGDQAVQHINHMHQQMIGAGVIER